MIDSIGVVLPARDEEVLLAAALDAVLTARAALVRAEPEWARAGRLRVVLVLDACVDGSLAIARTFGSAIEVLEVDVANVGLARRAGVERLLGASVTPSAHERSWIANTDADTEVPERWLLDHLAAARAGAELVVGRAEPKAADLDPAALSAWRREHTGDRRHVYGANLGIRGDVYRAAGGFPGVRVGEDVALVQAAEANGAAVLDLPFSLVQTSGRVDGRTPGGFAGYLRALVD